MVNFHFLVLFFSFSSLQDHSASKSKNSKKPKAGSTRSQEEQHIEENAYSTDNIEGIFLPLFHSKPLDIEFSSPTSAPPKLYSGSLFLYSVGFLFNSSSYSIQNDPFGCFTNENPESKDDKQLNKFFNYNKVSTSIPTPLLISFKPKDGFQKQVSYSQGDIDAVAPKNSNNFGNPIHETKSDLDISDMVIIFYPFPFIFISLALCQIKLPVIFLDFGN